MTLWTSCSQFLKQSLAIQQICTPTEALFTSLSFYHQNKSDHHPLYYGSLCSSANLPGLSKMENQTPRASSRSGTPKFNPYCMYEPIDTATQRIIYFDLPPEREPRRRTRSAMTSEESRFAALCLNESDLSCAHEINALGEIESISPELSSMTKMLGEEVCLIMPRFTVKLMHIFRLSLLLASSD